MDLYNYVTETTDGLSLGKTRLFTRQLAKGLEFLAENQIIHTDIRPENILVSADKSSIKISDFGKAFFTKNTLKHMKDLETMQNYEYRSPEIILRIQPTPSIDIWSLGPVITGMYTKQFCFSIDNETEKEKELVNTHRLVLQKDYSEDLIERGSAFGKEIVRKAHLMPKKPEISITDMLIDAAKTKKDSAEKIEQLYSLLSQIFEYDPGRRISAGQIQNSPFVFENNSSDSAPTSSSTTSLNSSISPLHQLSNATTSILQLGRNKTIYLITKNEKSFIIKTYANTTSGMPSLSHETAMLLFLNRKNTPCPQIIQTQGIYPLPSGERIGLHLEVLSSDLEYYLTQSPNNLSLNKIKSFTNQVTQALIFLNENHIIHRDIRTSHILIDETGTHVKLANFRAAIFTFEAHENIDTSNSPRRLKNKSPEAIFEIPLTVQSDIWALATVIAELCTKKRLFLLPHSLCLEDQNQAFMMCHMGTLDLPYDADLISQGSIEAQKKFNEMPKKRPRIDTLPEIMKTTSFYNQDNLNENGLALNLLERMLATDPKKRLTAEQVLAHPFLNEEDNFLDFL